MGAPGSGEEGPEPTLLVLWLELPAEVIVGQTLLAPEEAPGAAVARSLLEALERPLIGPPRRPERIRVADPPLASGIRAALGGGATVAVAPTPELDALLDDMRASFAGAEESTSYLEDGRVPTEAVAALFRAAERLYLSDPWRLAEHQDLFRLDVPGLEVEGWCAALVGSRADVPGLLLLPSQEGGDALALGPALAGPDPGAAEPGMRWLALRFERGAALPAPMRREAATHAWPVADANAYPHVERREADGSAQPPEERDVRIVAACAGALADLVEVHPDRLAADDNEPCVHTRVGDDGVETRIAFPYDAFVSAQELLAAPEPGLAAGAEAPPAAPAAAGPRVGRNAPCPCGSGRKYKKCCLPGDERARADRRPGDEAARAHALDGELVQELGAYAMARFGEQWLPFLEDFDDPDDCVQLTAPWSVYGFPVRGRPVVDWFLEDRAGALSAARQRWLQAQRAAWLSVWEVLEVEPGESVTLRDLLSHEERRVREASGSQTLVARDALLARVVDHEGVSLLCGAHPRALAPLDAANLVRRARGRLRRKRAVPVERLRDGDFGRYLIRRWEEAVGRAELRAAMPRDLQNTDGDAFLVTTDHFAFAPGERAAIEQCLVDLPGARPEEPDGAEREIVFVTPADPVHAGWQSTVVGRAALGERGLRLETNSVERADTLRRRLEDACGARLRHRARDHTDPLSPAVRAELPEEPPETPPPEIQEALREVKRRHYATWPDEALPALGGRSPREAVRTADGRRAVDALLKHMENAEQRSPQGALFDFSELRRELGLG